MHRPASASPCPTVPIDGELTLRVLGDPSLDLVTADGCHHRILGLGKPLALITYLAVAPQHEASREFLADLLWGDDSVSDPLHSLRNVLLLISKQVDATLIESSLSRCRLTRTLPSDLSALSQALGAHDLERAMTIYTGEFLPHFAAPGCRQFEHWCESVRLRVRTDVANAADVLVRQLLDAGRPRDAEVHARRMIEIDPLNQRGRRILLETLIAAGDRMAAITEAALTEQWLEAEEIDPEAATTALLQQARRVRPTPRSSAEALIAERPQDLSAGTDLVGRATEFAAIISAWESARAGTTTMVSIVAGAGIGKTRLLTDVENRLRAQRAQVVSVRALTNERDVLFSLVAALAGELAQLPGAAGVSASTGGVLVGLDSSLSSTFRATADFATSDQVLRRTRALQELLACVAEERTTVLLLDDLHWADDSSLTVLPALFARLTTSRVLVVTASRPGRGAVLADDRTNHLSLAALSVEQIGQLIASIRPLPQLPWSEALVQGIYAASRGIPLFALLALRDAGTRALVRVGESTWECDDPSTLDAGLRDSAALPTALRDLPQRARRALLQLAVAGRGVPPEMLADAAEPSPSLALHEALDALERRALIIRIAELVAVAHDVVAESALAGASDDERRAAARGMALAMLGADDRRWQERGVRLFSTVGTASELAPRLAGFLEGAVLPAGVTVTKALCTWLGESPEQRRLARAVARRLPWSLRIRPFRRHFAGAGVVASLFAVLPVWSATHPKALVDATLIGMAISGDSITRSFAAPITQSDWDASTLLHARAVRLGTLSVANVYTTLTPRLFQRTGQRLAERVYGDSGGSEIEVIDARGASTRLTAAPGDDVPSSWSPDGRFVAIESSRWSTLRHHQLGILDRATGVVRRLGRSDGKEGNGTWSPDGSRIAFNRHFLDARPSQLCVVDIDGEGERCTTGVSSQATNIGWRTPVEFLVAFSADILRVRPDSGWNVATLASDATAATLSPNGRWLAWLAASAPGTAFIAPSNAPVLARRVRWTPGDRPPALLTWGVKGESAPYIERITITSPADSVVIGVPHRFDIAARWSDSTDAPPPHVRWRLGARSDGDIDSLGTLIARRPGTIVVVASAGGWRTTSTRVVAVPAGSHLVRAENWASGLTAWRTFGDPVPTIVQDRRFGDALLNNGDGSYFSGAYSQERFQWASGLAVDAVLSTPVTELQWQTLDLDLRGSDNDQNLVTWDHRTGFMPTIARSSGASCIFSYPGREGVDGLMTIIPMAATRGDTPLQALRISNGEPYRVRLQVFPDGRCGMAVNGAPLFVSTDRFAAHVPLRLVTYGNSWKTRMLLGPLTVTGGVPDDIDWTRISRVIPTAMPSGPARPEAAARNPPPPPAPKR